MEKIHATRQAELKKMSDVRLAMKLNQAGVSTEQLETLDHKGMLDMWAEIVLAGHDTKPVASATSASYDVELERKKFEFEMRKYDEEKEERRKRLELEEKQWEEARYRKAQLKLQEDCEDREKEKRINRYTIEAVWGRNSQFTGKNGNRSHQFNPLF